MYTTSKRIHYALLDWYLSHMLQESTIFGFIVENRIQEMALGVPYQPQVAVEYAYA
jgi:hypothetical protein